MFNKKRSVQCSVLTDESQMYHDPNKILSYLTHHFSTDFSTPNTNPRVRLNKEHQLWEKLSQAETDNIQLVCYRSDLKFTRKKIWNFITAMKPKNSSEFDRISNKLIKQLP